MALTGVSTSIAKSPNAVEVWKGQTKDLELTITHEVEENGEKVERPFPLATVIVYCQVKSKAGDDIALISKSSEDSDQIEILTPDTDGKAMIHIVPDDTRLLQTDTYVFDVWVQLLSGKQYPVVEVSEFRIKDPVTRIP